MFRCHRTFGNYLAYVKLACEIKGAQLEVFSHPSLKRAKIAIEKRRSACMRAPHPHPANQYLVLVYVCRMLAPRLQTWFGHAEADGPNGDLEAASERDDDVVYRFLCVFVTGPLRRFTHGCPLCTPGARDAGLQCIGIIRDIVVPVSQK